jgi:aspartate racemase
MNSATEISAPEMLGVIGGLGPLASAEFLKTIYELSPAEREQDSPAVVLYSNPKFPDRTEAFKAGDDDILLEELNCAIDRLSLLGAAKIVICCLTIHHLLPKLPLSKASRIISLLDIIFEEVKRIKEPYLLACSLGAREQKLFENHSQWNGLQKYIVLLDPDDQRRLHYDFIYKLKRNCNLPQITPLLEAMLGKYNVAGMIAGCTEMHIVAKHYLFSPELEKRYSCVDPLMIVASRLAEGWYKPDSNSV